MREEFLAETRSLWESTHADKYQGRIFQSTGATESREFELTMDKVDRELEDAIKKHGHVILPKTHIQEFYEKIDKQKNRIVSSA